jgi:hypothetical protein
MCSILLLYKQNIKKRLTDAGIGANGANRFLIPKFLRKCAESDSGFVRRKSVNALLFDSKLFKKKRLKCCAAAILVSGNDS